MQALRLAAGVTYLVERQNMLSFILVGPQMGENIGAAARAMLNFGVRDLRLVAPRDGWPNEKADAMAAGAFAEMPPVQVFERLEDALADLHYVLATTARPRDMVKPVFTPESGLQELRMRFEQNQTIGIVFGAERAGLLNDDISLCHGVISIQTNPEFPALNLAQSVLLMAYEWNRTASSPIQEDRNIPAPHGEVNAFLERLDVALNESGLFFREENLKPTMQRNLRNIFTRHDLTVQEIRTLHGVLSALMGQSK
jgi:tRNA/rRNA methyltransferase